MKHFMYIILMNGLCTSMVGQAMEQTILQTYQDSVRVVDISKDGTLILAGVGSNVHVWKKENERWYNKGHISHQHDIAAVCFGANNMVVTTDVQGSVFLSRYIEGAMQPENAFKVQEDDAPATMIAINNKSDRLLWGQRDEQLSIYKRTVAHWDREEATIPIYEIMKPTAVGWKKNDVIVYGKSLDAIQAELACVITAWRCASNKWSCIKQEHYAE